MLKSSTAKKDKETQQVRDGSATILAYITEFSIYLSKHISAWVSSSE